MFPVVQLENAFNAYLRSKLDPDEITPASELAKHWLLSFKDEPNPRQAAVEGLVQTNFQLNAKRIYFALALACCVPTADLARIFRAYGRYMRENANELASWMSEVVTEIEGTHPVDVVRAIDLIGDPRHYSLACDLYKVDLESLRIAALASDNLRVFTRTLPADPGKKLIAQMEAIAKFPTKPESVIHRELIKGNIAKENLTYFRLAALYKQLSGEFTNGIEYLRPCDSSKITLLPGDVLNLKKAAYGTHPSICDEHGFADAVKACRDRILDLFFRPRGGMLAVNPANWERVDDIIEAFMDAGITADIIVHRAAQGSFKAPIDLKQAVTKLGLFDKENQRFYQVAYKSFLKGRDTQEVVANCINDKTLLAVYKATGNLAFIEVASDKVRESAMAVDLGL